VRTVSAQVGDIIEQVNTLKPSFETVEESMKSQSLGAQQISEAMVQINTTAQHTAESLRQANVALEELTRAAYDLQEETARFKAT
jgi:methyl-accepting chemotaxis protein WspA